jgi:hypothetical protein
MLFLGPRNISIFSATLKFTIILNRDLKRISEALVVAQCKELLKHLPV